MARIRMEKPKCWLEPGLPQADAPFSIYCIVEAGNHNGPCKVGVASNLSSRFASLQGGNWRPLLAVWVIRVGQRDDALHVEQQLLMKFRPNPYDVHSETPLLRSEWVSAGPTAVLEHAKWFCKALFGAELTAGE